MLFYENDGSHVWSVWRNYLNETAPMLFTDLRRKERKQFSQGLRNGSLPERYTEDDLTVSKWFMQY
jgi:hypothetical protein